MRDGFSTPGECPEGMWERELGRLVGGGSELRNVGERRADLREVGWRRETEGDGGRLQEWKGRWAGEFMPNT